MKATLIFALAAALAGCSAPTLRSATYQAPSRFDPHTQLRLELEGGLRLDVGWDHPETTQVSAEVVGEELVLRWTTPVFANSWAGDRAHRIRLDDLPEGWSSSVLLTAEGEALWDPAKIQAHQDAQRR